MMTVRSAALTKSTRRFATPVSWVLVVLGMALGSPGAARADALDAELFEKAKEVVTYLKDKGYKKVGVLKFRTQLPGQSASYVTGALNVNMAERLENALVLRINSDDNIRILHDAGQVIAGERAHLNYLRAEDRKRMFDLTYPGAWGPDRLKPDAFVTGHVKLTEDKVTRKRTVEVTLIALGRDTKAAEILSFRPKIDSSLLSDLGVSRRSRGPEALADFDPVDDKKGQGKQKSGEETDPAQNSQERFIQLVVRYGTQENKPSYDAGKSSWTVSGPNEGGQKVTMLVRNITQQPLGMVLKVNGINTLDLEQKEVTLCRLWVLEPGITYGIDGYYAGKKGEDFDVRPFKTVNDQEWESTSTKFPAPGKIELAVFISQKDPDPDPGPGPDPGPDTASMKISMRGLSQSASFRDRKNLSLAQLKGKLAAETGLSARSRGGVGLEDVSILRRVELSDLPNPKMVEDRMITYWAPPQSQ